MSDKIVNHYSSVTVKVENDIAIKSEVYFDDSASDNPMSHFEPDKIGNVLEFYKGENGFIKSEPIESESSGINNIGDSVSLDKRVKSHICSKCDIAFYLKGNLNKHISAVHLKLKKCVCGECDRAFSQLGDLKRHLDAVHRKKKEFSCGECDRAFSQLGDLKIHLDSVHRKLKKFSCGECDRAFAKKGHLKTHLHTVHRKLKRFTCGECSRDFTEKGHLKRHLYAVHMKRKETHVENAIVLLKNEES